MNWAEDGSSSSEVPFRVAGATSRSEVSLEAARAQLAGASWRVRREVAVSLADRPGGITRRVLDCLARRDPEWRVREAVASSLAQARDAAASTLEWMSLHDPHPRSAQLAVEALGRLVPPPGHVDFQPSAAGPKARAILGLLEQLERRHPDPDVRKQAGASRKALRS